MYKIKTTHAGDQIYEHFDRPDNIDGLDRQIVLNTLDYAEFIADMSDDYNRTKDERAAILRYRIKMGLEN